MSIIFWLQFPPLPTLPNRKEPQISCWGEMVLWDNSPLSPRFAAFSNKVTFLAPASCLWIYWSVLQCEQRELGTRWHSYILRIRNHVICTVTSVLSKYLIESVANPQSSDCYYLQYTELGNELAMGNACEVQSGCVLTRTGRGAVDARIRRKSHVGIKGKAGPLQARERSLRKKPNLQHLGLDL